MTTFEACTEDQLPNIAKQILDDIKLNKIVLFNGNLGAGKTTFIKQLCKALDMDDAFSSPTFSLINTYKSTELTIYHMDLYRVQDATELFDVGFEEYIDSGNICFIEWPEVAAPFISGIPHLTINIETDIESNCRKITTTQH